MNIEEIKKEVNLMNFSINKMVEHIKNINSLIEPAVPLAPDVPVTIGLTMTAAAGVTTYEQYKTAGWGDQQLIDAGFATAVTVTPAPPQTGAPAPPQTGAPAPPQTGAPAPPQNAVTITPEELNITLTAEFTRLGDRVQIDTAFKQVGATCVTDLPVEKYQELINIVKAIPKAV